MSQLDSVEHDEARVEVKGEGKPEDIRDLYFARDGVDAPELHGHFDHRCQENAEEDEGEKERSLIKKYDAP